MNRLLPHPVVLISLLLIASILVGCGGSEDRKKKHLETGEKLLLEGNYQKARVEFKNALQIDPKDASAFLALGKIHEKLQNYNEAAKAYTTAVQLDDSQLEARVLLAKLYLLGLSPDKAEELSEEILQKQPEHLGGVLIRAGVKVQRENILGAVDDLEWILSKDPQLLDAVALLSSIYAKQGKLDQSISLLESVLSTHKTDTRIRYSLSQLYLEQQENQKAIDILKENQSISPKDMVHTVRLARVYGIAGESDNGISAFDQTIGQLQGQEQLDGILTQADYMRHYKGIDEAVAKLNQYIKKNPEQYDLQLGLADLYLRSKKTLEAENTYQSVIDAKPEDVYYLKAVTRLAKLKLADAKDDEALALLKTVLDKSPQNSDALLLRADYYLAKNKPEPAMLDLKAVLNNDPNDSAVLKRIARAHILNGDPELALENLSKAAKASPADLQIRSALGALLTRFGYFDRAAENYRDVLKLKPKDPTVHIELIKALISSKNYDEAKQRIDKYKKISDSHQPSADYLRGLIAQAENDFQGSLKYFNASLAAKPESPEPLMGLTKSAIALGKPEVALKKIDEILALKKENAFALNLKGELLSGQQRKDASMASFKAANRVKSDWAVPYRNIAALQLQNDDVLAAENTYKKGINKAKDKSILLMGLSSLYVEKNRIDDAAAIYEKMIADNISADTAKNNLAMILVAHKKDKQSLQRAKELSLSFKESNNPSYLDTYGWVMLKNDQADLAVQALQKAASRAPESAVIQYHLGSAYHMQGQPELAATHLQRAVDSTASFDGKDQAKKLLSEVRVNNQAVN